MACIMDLCRAVRQIQGSMEEENDQLGTYIGDGRWRNKPWTKKKVSMSQLSGHGKAVVS